MELRNPLASERTRLAELRQRAGQATGRANSLQDQMIRDRLHVADQAELVADHAEASRHN